MKRIVPFLLTLVPAFLLPAESSAADHYDAYDGDFVTSDNVRHHDIVDVFTFPSADKKRLVMIMNTYNRANASSVFDDKLAYTFRIMTGRVPGAGNEYRFTCRFNDVADGRGQTATCAAYRIVTDPSTRTGRKAKWTAETSVAVDTVSSNRRAFQVFAGRRADAFFGDAGGLGEMLVTHKLPDAFKGPVTSAGPRNVTAISDDLSIALEVDLDQVFQEKATILRVAVETAYPKKDQ